MRAIIVLLVALALRPAAGDELRIDSRRQWQSWKVPQGAVEVRGDGSVVLQSFGSNTDPMNDMAQFEHPTRKSGMVRGGAQVFSNSGSARLLYDDDPGTWWQPRAADGLDKWWVDVDLGRVVLLNRIRVVFPDTAGARPFEDFSIFVSEGATVSSTEDVYRFHRVATTTRPNRERVREFELFTLDPLAGGAKAQGENMVTGDTLHFRPVQYVRFVPHKLTQDAALAELEMVAVGENLALSTLQRGGGIRAGLIEDQVPFIFDGTVDNAWNPHASRPAETFWRDGGQWFEWDLGVAFWLERIVFYSWPPTEVGRSTYYTASGNYGHRLQLSDGSPIALAGSGEGERIQGRFDYEQLSLVNNVSQPRRWIFDHQFQRRKARYIFWNHEFNPTGGWGFLMFETFVFGSGYPAEVVLESDFIDLSGAKEITGVSWQADLPPGTAVEIRTKTGEALIKKTLYYDRNGKEVSAERYFSLRSVARGDTTQITVEGEDWSSWSEPYKSSGEEFRSPSPRRFLRAQVIFSTQDPQVTPVLRSLSFFYNDALLQRGIEAEVFPREARVGEWQEFRLHLRPAFAGGDQGFDGLVVPVPSEVRDVSLSVGGISLSDFTFVSEGDSLRLSLPARVFRDSVVVVFSARPLANPTRFDAAITNSSRPNSRQVVKSSHRDALNVFLPDVALDERIIGDLALAARSFTPNGDGINDDLLLRFDLFKVDVVPRVSVYDLAGRQVRALIGQSEGNQAYAWDGRDEAGERVPPGLYILRVEVEVETGTKRAARVFGVAY